MIQLLCYSRIKLYFSTTSQLFATVNFLGVRLFVFGEPFVGRTRRASFTGPFTQNSTQF